MRFARLGGIMLAAILSVFISPALGATAFADDTAPTPLKASGTINASEIAPGAAIELEGDTTIVMDADLSITSVSGYQYALTITGNGAFSAHNPEGNAVYVASFTSDTDVSASGAGQYHYGIFAQSGPIKINGDVTASGPYYALRGYGIEITGNVDATASDNTAIFSSYEPIRIEGDVKAVGTRAGIYGDNVPIEITGNVDATAPGNGSDGWAIYAQSYIAIVGDVVAKGYNSGIYVNQSYGSPAPTGPDDYSLTVKGSVVAEGEQFAGIYTYPGSTRIEAGKEGACSGAGKSYAIYSGNGIHIDAKTIEANGGYALYANGPIELTGDVKATGDSAGIYNWNSRSGEVSDITIDGSVEVVAGSNVGIRSSEGSVHITGDADVTIGRNATGWCAINVNKTRTLEIDGSATIHVEDAQYGINVDPDVSTIVHGDLTVTGGATAIMCGSLTVYGDVDAVASVDNKGSQTFYIAKSADFYGDVTASGCARAIYAYEGVRFHGGAIHLSATDPERAFFGILSEGPVICEGDVVVDGGKYGIVVKPRSDAAGDAKIIIDASRLEATGSLRALAAADGIEIRNPMAIVEPQEGSIGTASSKVYDGDAEETEFNVIVDADGTPTTHALIMLPDPVVTRIAGDYANETAAAISAAAFPQGSEWVVIARDDDFADALGATGLAGALECPIVLTGRTQLSEAAAEEIGRLGAKHAYVIGGTGAIKEQVDADLAALGVAVEPRVWGENSYDTSLECAKEIVKVTGSDDPKVIVAMSTNFQDALSISPIAYRLKAPLVLQTWGATSAERGFTKEAAAWLAGKAPLVVGGPGAISDASFEGIELKNAPFRIYGETGYDTSDAIAEWAVATGWLTDSAAVFACGAQAPRGVDALAGSALAGRLGCPILLVNGNEAMESADTTTISGYFESHKNSILNVYVLGGTYVMPEALYNQIEKTLTEAPVHRR